MTYYFEIWLQTGTASSVVNLVHEFEFLRLTLDPTGKCGPAVTTFSTLNYTLLELPRVFSLSWG